MPDPFALLTEAVLAPVHGLSREDVTVFPGGGPGRAITAVFDFEPFEDDQGFSGEAPMLTARTSDLAGMRDGDTVTVGADAYVFRHSREGGRGMSTAFLQEA